MSVTALRYLFIIFGLTKLRISFHLEFTFPFGSQFKQVFILQIFLLQSREYLLIPFIEDVSEGQLFIEMRRCTNIIRLPPHRLGDATVIDRPVAVFRVQMRYSIDTSILAASVDANAINSLELSRLKVVTDITTGLTVILIYPCWMLVINIIYDIFYFRLFLFIVLFLFFPLRSILGVMLFIGKINMF